MTEKELKKLNQLFAEEFWFIMQDLNKWCVKKNIVKDRYNEYTIYDITNYNNFIDSANVVSKKEEAFLLTPVVPLLFIDKEVTYNELDNNILIRQQFTNEFISNILLDNDISTMKPIVYCMIKALRTLKGYDENTLTAGICYASFNLPGSTGDYFRQMYTPPGGLELRLYSNCHKINIV